MAELELATASSATSMEHPSTAAHLALNDRINHPEDHSKEQYGHSFILTDNDRRRETSCIAKMSKKRLATPIETPAVCKKIRIPAVQRTHSPRTQESSQTVVTDRCPQLQKVTPTLKGIKEVCRHLLTRNTGEKAHLVAIPTECTYEICSAISWSKRESLSEEEVALRNHQLDQLVQASSRSSVHVYMTHQNIRHLDKLLFFPKKTYAIRQNPNDIARFNESRIIFQRLADIFWPGAVIIYLQPESFAPPGLVHSTSALATTNSNSSNSSINNNNNNNDRDKCDGCQHYIGFRCPSHPLTVKILKQLHQECSDPMVLVGSVAQREGTSMFKAKDVAYNFAKMSQVDSKIQVLNGEERREIFAVPTCDFQDDWLECWIDAKTRTVTLKNKSRAAVGRNIKGHQMLRETNTKNRVIRSILHYWKVADMTEE